MRKPVWWIPLLIAVVALGAYVHEHQLFQLSLRRVLPG
jgi:hypothetical protein